MKDTELADEVEQIAHDADGDESRRAVLDAIARRYTPVATASG